jgi:hypothetical protein
MNVADTNAHMVAKTPPTPPENIFPFHNSIEIPMNMVYIRASPKVISLPKARLKGFINCFQFFKSVPPMDCVKHQKTPHAVTKVALRKMNGNGAWRIT